MNAETQQMINKTKATMQSCIEALEKVTAAMEQCIIVVERLENILKAEIQK